MTPDKLYIGNTLRGDVEFFMEHHSIKHVRECMALCPSEICWNTRKNWEIHGIFKDISHGRSTDFSQALASSNPTPPELPAHTIKLVSSIEPPQKAAEFKLATKAPEKTVDFGLPAKPPDDFPKPKPPREPPDPDLIKPPVIDPKPPAKPSIDSFEPKLPIKTLPLDPSSIAEAAETNSAIHSNVHQALTFLISACRINFQTEFTDRPLNNAFKVELPTKPPDKDAELKLPVKPPDKDVDSLLPAKLPNDFKPKPPDPDSSTELHWPIYFSPGGGHTTILSGA